ncbi:MAG: DUF1330 domain-containing protein [Candidatus Acidiferrales bacterium]
MPKAYWISWYRSISNPAALAEYAKLAGPALQAQGGRTIVRGKAVKTFEGGTAERTVIIEFDSVEKAIAAYESEAYKAARKKLEGAVEREIRIVEGI